MKHYTTPAFWKHYNSLPKRIQALADKNYRLLKTEPFHPSLHFKKVGKYWSVRIGTGYRALAVEHYENRLWFWIGTHAEYDNIIS